MLQSTPAIIDSTDSIDQKLSNLSKSQTFAISKSHVVQLIRKGSFELFNLEDNTQEYTTKKPFLKKTPNAKNSSTDTFPKVYTQKLLFQYSFEKHSLTLLKEVMETHLDKYHKDFNPIAQSTPFYISRKFPENFNLDNFQIYLRDNVLEGNIFLLWKSMKIYEKCCQHKPSIIHKNTMIRLFVSCCLLTGKFYLDDFGPKNIINLMAVKSVKKICEMESMQFIDILDGKLKNL